MTTAKPADKLPKKNGGKPFAKGYDARRWMQGRPKIPENQKVARDIFSSVFWEELSVMVENKETGEIADALRWMVRSMIRDKKTRQFVVEYLSGKIPQAVDVNMPNTIMVNIIRASEDKENADDSDQ